MSGHGGEAKGYRIEEVTGKLLSAMNKLRESNTGLDDHNPQEGDIFVVCFPKSGTTMLQNMMYNLVVEAGGAPSWDPTGTGYTDIGQVVPWAEFSKTTGIKSCESKPRLFKTHMPVNFFNLDDKRTRYIYCYRNGLDLPASFLDFTIEWMNPGIKLSAEDRLRIFSAYLRNYFLAPAMVKPGENTGVGRWFQHVKGWTSEKRDNLLVLNYEEICEDLVGTTYSVAKFMGLQISDETIRRVAAKCDRAVMVKDEKFREKLVTNQEGWDPQGGIKVRLKGTDGFRSVVFSEAERKLYDKMFMETFGVRTFPQLVEQIRKQQGHSSVPCEDSGGAR